MDMNVASTERLPCYSGIYGTCANCDATGSCICGFFESGHSDMLTMDRTRWDGIIYICSIDMRVYYSIWFISAIVNMFLAARSIYGLKVHIKTARRMNQQIHGSRIVRFFGFMLATCLVDSALCFLKIIMPAQLIGIDFAPSLLLYLQRALLTVALATHAVHLTATALSTQESTLGRARITEGVLRAAWGNYLLAAVSSCSFVIPVLGAVASSGGEHSETQQQIFLVTTIVCILCAAAANLIQQLRRARRMLHSYDRSIQALKASLIIARGGVSLDAANSSALPDSDRNEAPKPAYVVVIEADIQKLESAKQNVRRETKKGTVVILFAILIASLFLIPFLWSRFSYSVCINNLIVKLALYPILSLYLPKRKRQPAADSEGEGHRGHHVSATPPGVVQSV